MKGIIFEALSSLLTIITNLLFATIAYIKLHFTPPKEKVKGLMTVVVSKVQAVAFEAKAWMYDLFSRQHIIRYS